MGRFIVLLLTISCVAQTQTIAEKMANSSGLGWLDSREEAVKRYEYILPKLRASCSDAAADVNAAYMLVVGYKHVKEAGASKNENLLEFAENAYKIVQRLRLTYREVKMPMKCAELFTMYTVARREGKAPEQAIKTVTEGVEALLGLLK